MELRYAWEWRYKGRPALERRWRLVAGAAVARSQVMPEDFEEEFPLWAEPLGELEPAAEEGGEETEVGEGEEPLRPQVDAQEPEVWRVWAYASRAQVAEQLFGEARAVGGFDYERCEAPEEGTGLSACVRVRQVAALRPALQAEVRRALEALLKAEEALLRDWEPSEQQHLLLAERSLVWAQRAEMADEQGRSYFDRYLALLADKRVAGDWDMLGSCSEQLKKVVALRARQWKTSYPVEDGTPRLRPGDVVGRSYYSRSLPERRFSVAVRVRELLLEDASQGGAELRLRNGRWQGLRVLVPGKDGLWRGYVADKLEHVAALPHFHLGRQGEQAHLLNVPLEQTPDGETLVRFRPVHLRFAARYFPAPEEDPTSRGLQARDWVRVELHGAEPETRLMTALELGLLAPNGGSELLWSAVGRLSELYMLYGGVAALGQAPLVVNFLARDVRTPWKSLQKAAEQPGNLPLQLQVRRLLRGIASEMVLGQSAPGMFPAHRVTGRQVLLPGGHIIDFELQALRAVERVIHHALEVKGWTADTWRRALDAWSLTKVGAPLDSRQGQLVKQLRRLIGQLRDAATPPRGRPFLVCTDKLNPKTLSDLQQFLLENSLKVNIKPIKELEMIETARRLRAALSLPEQLPGKRTGGTP